MRRLAAWAEQGHLIGNHTYTHTNNSSRADPVAMMADVLRAEPLLTRNHTFARLFRFPFLAEGRTAEARDGMRALLASTATEMATSQSTSRTGTSRAALPSG